MLLPGVTSLAISRCIAVDHLAVGDFNVSARAAGIGLITTIGADLLFIPKFGALGAALASSVAYAVAMMVHSIAFRRRYR